MNTMSAAITDQVRERERDCKEEEVLFFSYPLGTTSQHLEEGEAGIKPKEDRDARGGHSFAVSGSQWANFHFGHDSPPPLSSRNEKGCPMSQARGLGGLGVKRDNRNLSQERRRWEGGIPSPGGVALTTRGEGQLTS